MNILLILVGLILIIIYWIKRIKRTITNDEKFFEGSTLGESIIQWIGFALTIIGFLI